MVTVYPAAMKSLWATPAPPVTAVIQITWSTLTLTIKRGAKHLVAEPRTNRQQKSDRSGRVLTLVLIL